MKWIFSYKGKTVIRQIVPGLSSFSLGAIFLKWNKDSDGKYFIDENTLKHEFGHTVQLEKLGLFKYLRYIAVPSVKGYFKRIKGIDYYNQPWERSADFFGGVERRGYSENSLKESMDYINSKISK